MFGRGVVAVLAAGLLVSVAGCTGSGSASVESSPAGEPLDLLVVADSGGEGIAEKYAPLAAEALGREVVAHSHTIPGATIRKLQNAVKFWADDVADAEILVFYVNPWGFEPPGSVECFKAEGAASQVPPGTTWEPVPEMPSAGDFREYQDELQKMYDTFWTLREDQPTIMRAYGWPDLWVPVWRRLGIETECMAQVESLEQARREVVEANGGVYVSMLDAFNGPQHDEDPIAKGLIQDDWLHLNEDGQQLLAETLAEAGFDTSEPPN